MSELDDLIKDMMGDMGGRPASTKDGKRNNRSKNTDEYARDAIIYKRFFEGQHSNSHSIGWMIFGFSVVCLIAGLGTVGGIWDSIPNSEQTNSFKSYCYATWAILALGIVLSTAMAGYFYHTMRMFRLGHEVAFKNFFMK
jgi:hypothetical protein